MNKHDRECRSYTQDELIRVLSMTYVSAFTACDHSIRIAIRSFVDTYDAEHGCRTEITAEGDRTRITSDSEILRTIISEILGNAHETSSGEGVTLRWSVTDGQVLIMIKNRGEIKDDEFDEVFSQPFYTTKSGHSGLGMSIARRYAGVLGGVIRGISLHGYTIVTIRLPLAQSENVDLHKERELQCPPF